MPYATNPGRLPRECVIRDESGSVVGHRHCHVRLFGGWCSRKAMHAPWPSQQSNWSISRRPHPFEIESYEVI